MRTKLRYKAALFVSVALVGSLFSAPAQASPTSAPVATVVMPTAKASKTQMNLYPTYNVLLDDKVTVGYARTASKTVASVRIYDGKGQAVHLQRKIGKKWKSVGKKKTVKTTKARTLKIRVPSKAGMHSYRLVMPKTKNNKRFTSKTFKIFMSDSKKYKAKEKVARSAIKAYCPKTPILFNTPRAKKAKNGAVGYTVGGDFFGVGFWSQMIELKSGLKGQRLQHGALNACANIVLDRSMRLKPKTSDKVLERIITPFPGADKLLGFGNVTNKDINRVFAAVTDCMAAEVTARPQYMTFNKGKTCDAAQRSSSRYAWKKLGKKYQKPIDAW